MLEATRQGDRDGSKEPWQGEPWFSIANKKTEKEGGRGRKREAKRGHKRAKKFRVIQHVQIKKRARAREGRGRKENGKHKLWKRNERGKGAGGGNPKIRIDPPLTLETEDPSAGTFQTFRKTRRVRAKTPELRVKRHPPQSRFTPNHVRLRTPKPLLSQPSPVRSQVHRRRQRMIPLRHHPPRPHKPDTDPSHPVVHTSRDHSQQGSWQDSHDTTGTTHARTQWLKEHCQRPSNHGRQRHSTQLR